MKRIKFETSIGWFEASVLPPDQDVIIDKENYWRFKEHLDFWKIKILDDKWITITLSDSFYGNPEYKYEIIE